MKKLTESEARRHIEHCMREVCALCRYRAAAQDTDDAGELADMCADCQARYAIEETVGLFAETETADDPAFDIIWAAYPNKNGKKEARRAFAKISPDESLLMKMLAAIETAKCSTRWKRGYVMELARWLREERYNDGAIQEARADGYHGYEERPRNEFYCEEIDFDG